MNGESRWVVDDEIPSMETDSDAPMTKEDAEKMWKRYLEHQPRQIERFRHCMGCVHLRQAGGAYLVCCYLLHTDKKRPCEFGRECPVKEVTDGFRFPDGYLEWCSELDRREVSTRHGKGTRGRTATWDTDYGKGLFDRGYSITEISGIMDVPLNTVTNYATQHLWNYNEDGSKKRKQFSHATPETITAEREAFRRHLAEKE